MGKTLIYLIINFTSDLLHWPIICDVRNSSSRIGINLSIAPYLFVQILLSILVWKNFLLSHFTALSFLGCDKFCLGLWFSGSTKLVTICEVLLLHFNFLHFLLRLAFLQGYTVLFFDSLVNDCPPFFKLLNPFYQVIVMKMCSSYWAHILLTVFILLLTSYLIIIYCLLKLA